MKNIAVIYKSKYGATKKYAEWLANELACPIFEFSKTKDLSKYETVIYGCPILADTISGAKKFATIKTLIIFTVGLRNPSTSNYEAITKTLPAKAKVFHLRGALNPANLSPLHKLGFKFLKNVLSKTPIENQTEDDKTLLDACTKKVDFTDKSAILPIVKHIKELEKAISVNKL